MILYKAFKFTNILRPIQNDDCEFYYADEDIHKQDDLEKYMNNNNNFYKLTFQNEILLENFKELFQ